MKVNKINFNYQNDLSRQSCNAIEKILIQKKNSDFLLYKNDSVSFGHAPKFKEKYIEYTNLECACCGRLMLSNKLFKKLEDIFNTNHIIPQNITKTLIEFLEPFEENLHQNEQIFFIELKDISKENPKMNLSEIILLLQKESIEELDFNTLNLTNEILKIKKNNITEKEFAQRVARKIIFPSLATVEHIKPVSGGGESKAGNYLCECMECNYKRGNTPFCDWVKQNPHMPENIKKQINKIKDLIKSNLLEDEGYIREVTETLRIESEGLIDII